MKFKASSAVKKILLSLFILMLIYAGLGFFLVPKIIADQARKNISSYYKTDMRIEKIFFNPFTFELEINNLDIAGESAHDPSRLKFKKFYVNLEILPLLKKEIRLSSVVLDAADLQFTIFSPQKTNWTPVAGEAPTNNSAPVSKIEENKNPWTLNLQKIQISETQIGFSDFTLRSALNLKMGPLDLNASNINTKIGAMTSLDNLSLAIGDEGHLNLVGTASLDPVSADLNFEAQKIPVHFLTSYLSESTHLKIKEGTTDFQAHVLYSAGKISSTANVKLNNFKVVQSQTSKMAFTWKSLVLDGIEMQSSPLKLHIANVNLIQASTALSINKDGSSSFNSYLIDKKTKPTAKAVSTEVAASGKKEKPFDILVSHFQITNAQLDFADLQIKPNFKAHIDQLNGHFTPLNLLTREKIVAKLTGQVETYGKFSAQGYVIPKGENPAMDMKLSFKNIEMTTFTPYSGHFAGYEIAKGKLFLDLNYTLLQKKIKGQNDVLLDQFTLGQAVESEESTNLPVKLALALMKDRDGKIKFKLPVEGDVNSPSFSFGNLIFTALKNMLLNIVAAPFDFISSLVGGSGNLESVYFDPGTAVLTADQLKKINDICNVLSERPNLAIEVEGQYDESDITALKNKKILGGDIPETELKSLALKRGQLVQAELVKNKIPAERIYLLAAQKNNGEAKPPRAKLNLKNID